MGFRHISVMPEETVDMLNCRKGKIYVDGTLGGAGHARAILERILPGGLLIGIDQDMDAINNARLVLEPFQPNVRIVHANYAALPDILAEGQIETVDGILLDLGVSLHQIEKSNRGFSFLRDEPLDMRMDTRQETTVEQLVNRLSADELETLFRTYGEERWARRIALHLVTVRKETPFRSSRQLAEAVQAAVPKKASRQQRIHPATRVFMALRIAVNRELEKLERFLDQAESFLNPGGRLCVLAFHSLEDRLVKRRMKEWETGCICPPDFPKCVCNRRPRFRLLTRKPLRPSEAEVSRNPMARSARLRAAEKLEKETMSTP